MQFRKMNICDCGKPVEKVREDFGLKMCRDCAFSLPDDVPIKGRMVYSHKTGSEIEIMTTESYNANKKYFMPNGPRSSVKNFMRG
tara:strand:+ start:2355 stop:2609 length:255 start_codon:yes stop_codon:yes gene_type:complete